MRLVEKRRSSRYIEGWGDEYCYKVGFVQVVDSMDYSLDCWIKMDAWGERSCQVSLGRMLEKGVARWAWGECLRITLKYLWSWISTGVQSGHQLVLLCVKLQDLPALDAIFFLSWWPLNMVFIWLERRVIFAIRIRRWPLNWFLQARWVITSNIVNSVGGSFFYN